ncbi:MAG: chemotaxis-specific protein-glutamate methyltransferase CheB [Myxococcales bacterium]|nr:chemotaxis-specific protein-glutamate methyltransferase CheB [Myxococcales bacterium]
MNQRGPSDPVSDAHGKTLRVLVVDDSAYNRQTLTSMLEADPQIEVVGRAINGRDALQSVMEVAPDVITLDLEMPEMDGFAFLRLLMARRPTPVIVISSHSARDTVFRALELGAMDFMAKPSRQIGPELREIQGELLRKIRLVKRLHAVRLQHRAQALALQRDARVTREMTALPDPEDASTQGDARPVVIAHAPTAPAPAATSGEPLGIVGIAASTGGPPAVQQLLCGLPGDLPIAVLVAQHMPARFTRAFASRLDKMCSLRVNEAIDGAPLQRGHVYISPGASNIEIAAGDDGVQLVVRTPEGAAQGKITPSADLMLRAAAAQYGRRFCAVVLTGMGSDGREGAVFAREQGSLVVVEDPQTAVMPGMPQSVIDAGAADEVHALDDIPEVLIRFAERCKGGRGGA